MHFKDCLSISMKIIYKLKVNSAKFSFIFPLIINFMSGLMKSEQLLMLLLLVKLVPKVADTFLITREGVREESSCHPPVLSPLSLEAPTHAFPMLLQSHLTTDLWNPRSKICVCTRLLFWDHYFGDQTLLAQNLERWLPLRKIPTFFIMYL